LSFDTVKAIMSIQAREIDRPARDMKAAAVNYGKLRAATARKAIHYYRLQERAGLS
jgi:hypothetical protein